MKSEDLQPATTALVERFHAVLYPFPLEGLLDLLPEKGWIVPLVERDQDGIKLSGPITKGNVKLSFDVNLRTFGARGIEPPETLHEFRSLQELIASRFGFDPEVSSHYTEFRFVGRVDLGRDAKPSGPLRLDAWWSGHSRSEALSSKMAKWLPDLGAYGIRMATRGVDPNRTDWTELTIAPLATSGSRFYTFDLLYRHHDKSLVESVCEAAKELIVAAVEELER